MESYSKKVKAKELLLTFTASYYDIAPYFVDYEIKNDRYIMLLEQWPTTLINESAWEKYKKKAIELIKNLHSIGIFHSDITEENFVVNPSTGEIKLINFGLSCWIDELTENNFNVYQTKASCVKELLEIEVQEVEWLFNNHR